MQKITSADQRKLSSFVKDLYCLDSVQLILERVAQGLPMLIGADSVFVATADPKRNRVALLAENVGPELHQLWPTLVALRNENPAISHHMSHPNGPALMIEDIMPMSQWKRTAVFNEFYDQLGMWARLSLSLSIGRPEITGIVAHRAHGTFTERHRFILNLLGLHVCQLVRTRNCGKRLWRRFSGHWNQSSEQASSLWTRRGRFNSAPIRPSSTSRASLQRRDLFTMVSRPP